MNRMLVVGAGATIEECKRSGAMPNDPEWQFPTISNFGNRLFDRLPTPQLIMTNTDVQIGGATFSGALLVATANYLQNQKISFDTRFLNPQDGDFYSEEDLTKSPVAIFCELEKKYPQQHNIETFCEYTWQLWGNNHEYWERFIYEGIYFKLFTIFSQQFGLGLGRQMNAGQKVASQVNSGDNVLNLNYDIAFDLALVQTGKLFCYAPEIHSDKINIFKPHGSFNLYVNLANGDFFFKEPQNINGSVKTAYENGTFSPYGGILPPRLNKNYKQHPLAEYILDMGRPFHARIVTFWGVGLTPSDVDLLAVYKEATESAETIEFINPDSKAHENAEKLLNRQIKYFPTLHDWFELYGISD